MNPSSLVLLLFPFGDEFLELNLGTAQEAVLNSSSRSFQGLVAVLSIKTRQADVMLHHNKDDYNKHNSNHHFTTAAFVWSRTTNPLKRKDSKESLLDKPTCAGRH